MIDVEIPEFSSKTIFEGGIKVYKSTLSYFEKLTKLYYANTLNKKELAEIIFSNLVLNYKEEEAVKTFLGWIENIELKGFSVKSQVNEEGIYHFVEKGLKDPDLIFDAFLISIIEHNKELQGIVLYYSNIHKTPSKEYETQKFSIIFMQKEMPQISDLKLAKKL